MLLQLALKSRKERDQNHLALFSVMVDFLCLGHRYRSPKSYPTFLLVFDTTECMLFNKDNHTTQNVDTLDISLTWIPSTMNGQIINSCESLYSQSLIRISTCIYINGSAALYSVVCPLQLWCCCQNVHEAIISLCLVSGTCRHPTCCTDCITEKASFENNWFISYGHGAGSQGDYVAEKFSCI